MNKALIALTVAVFTLLTVTVASAAAAPAENLIEMGDRGGEVTLVQKLLADTGFYAGAIDGVFGGGTFEAVEEFQAYAGLPSDGVVGKETLAYLERERDSANPGRHSRALAMTATAYTAYDYGNGSFTYRGHSLRRGLAAVDPRVIPLGSRLYIPGYGYAIADDTGSAIKGSRIDLAFENRGEALQFGRQRVTVYILN